MLAAREGGGPLAPGSGTEPGVILQVQHLTKTHLRNDGGRRVELPVLDDLNFDIRDGEFVTIIGPSGCGKTTLLNIIAGMEPCEEGEIRVNGHGSLPGGAGILIIFQEDALFPWLTVKENVAFGLRNAGLPKERRNEIASQYIEMVQLGQFSNSYLHQLSGGMRQRVAIARGLAMDPRILLMDEPFGALDYRTREILQEQIQVIHERTKKTILFVTHDVREAVSLGDRVLLLSRRPARIKRQYVVNLPRPRLAEDPRFHDLIKEILGDLRGEVSSAETAGEPDGRTVS